MENWAQNRLVKTQFGSFEQICGGRAGWVGPFAAQIPEMESPVVPIWH